MLNRGDFLVDISIALFAAPKRIIMPLQLRWQVCLVLEGGIFLGNPGAEKPSWQQREWTFTTLA